MSRPSPWQRAVVAAGLGCLVLGLAVMLLWLAEPTELAARHPAVFAMKFNAGLAFALIGLAYLATTRGLRLLPAAMMVPVVLYGALALAQHIFDLDLGIDTLLYTPFIDIGTSRPGRIAPNTALCFLLVGLAVALRALARQGGVIQTALGFAVVMIAAAALIGYAIALDIAHDWMMFTRMSLQSAGGFALIGAALLFVDAEKAGYPRTALAALVGLATYLLLLTLTYRELFRFEQAYGITFSARAARGTLSSLVLISGTLYAALIGHLFQSARKARRMAADLAENRVRLAAVIDNAVDGIITIDEQGTVQSVNPACTRIFGYARHEMIGRNVKMLMPEPYHSAHDGYLERYHRTGEARIIGAGREAAGRRKDGSVFPLELSVAKLDLGGTVAYSGVVRDISERKRAETALIEANTELEEFAYRTSHDLRSPIASSLGLLAISRDMLKEGDTQALGETMERMERNFRRLDHLIQNIIALTRNRLMVEEAEPIRVRAVVAEAIDALSHLDEVKRIAIENHVAEELTIVGKPSKFQVVVGNLLSNAVKYHDPGETPPRIDVRAERKAGRVWIVVEDNGLGVPPASRHLLFQMFKRLHPNRSFGSGLGLYILKKSTEALGGTALYEAREKGSRFIIELPQKETQ